MRRDERERDIVHAWWIVNIAAMTWSKGRVPDLQGLLNHGRPAARAQSIEEQRAILQQLSQRLGRPLRTNADKRRLQMRKAAS